MQLDCEWNDKYNRQLTAKEILNGESHAKAVFYLGCDNQLAVCETCDKNPILVKRFKVVKAIN